MFFFTNRWYLGHEGHYSQYALSRQSIILLEAMALPHLAILTSMDYVNDCARWLPQTYANP